MVLAETAARIFAPRLQVKAQIPQRRNAAAHRVRETLNVYDFDVVNGDKLIWQASLPLDILQEHLPETCRYSHDVGQIRWMGLVVGALAGMGLAGLGWYALFVVAMGTPLLLVLKNLLILGAVVGLGPGAVIGWTQGPRFRRKGVWLVRRLTFTEGNEDSDLAKGQDDPENLTVLQIGDGKHSWRVVRALSYTGIVDVADEQPDAMPVTPASLAFFGAKDAGGERTNGVSDVPEYHPIVHRAAVFYEDLKQSIVRKRRGRKSISGWHKLQIGATIGLAAAIVALMIFAGLVLEKKQSEGGVSPKASQVMPKSG